ncbi:MAG: thiamine-phosphate kinase [Synechococcales bacterium]|nr:thiamine-phosphate kinase [Synechococcales bacterium]
MRVSELGEQGLLRRLHQFCPPDLVGDDAALLSVQPNQKLVVTTDVLVDGVHFSIGMAANPPTTAPEDVGWRSVAANLSDLAAMGATPLGITVGLSLPGDLAVEDLEAMYRGMVACLSAWGGVIAGGDVCRSPILSVAIAAFGQVSPQAALRRSTARPGDRIVVTGIHGASRAGLELLLNPSAGEGLGLSDRQQLIRAHQRPRPRLDVAPALAHLQAFTRVPSGIAGMDSSDGLADAVLQICRASGVGAWLDRAQIPLPPAFAHWLPADQAMDWALYGGEDFELVLFLPEAIAHELVDYLGGEACIIGSVTKERTVVLGDRTGQWPDQVLSLEQGFQHF